MLVLNAFNGVIFASFCSLIGMSQREDSGSRIPFRTTCFCWLVTITSFFLKVTSIPPSQTTGIENSGLVISLTTVAFFNSGDRAGICSSMVVCVVGTLDIDLVVFKVFSWEIHWYKVDCGCRVGVCGVVSRGTII